MDPTIIEMAEAGKGLLVAGAGALSAKPVAETVTHVAKGSFDAARHFLARICVPAADELGLFFQDKVNQWRALNAAKIMALGEEKFIKDGKTDQHAHPRMICQILEQGSLADEDEIQSAWAGLLSAACNEEGRDDGGLVFTNILSGLTSVQVRLINFLATNSRLSMTTNGLVFADSYLFGAADLYKATGCRDVDRLTREFEYLKGQKLLEGEAEVPSTTGRSEFRLSVLGVQFYVRCQGYHDAPKDYYKDKHLPFGARPLAGELSLVEKVTASLQASQQRHVPTARSGNSPADKIAALEKKVADMSQRWHEP